MVIELESVFNTEGLKVPFDYELSLSHVEVSGICPIQKPVRVNGSVGNKAGIVTLKGQASFLYEAPCDRCAEDVSREFTVELEHILVRELNNDDNDDYTVVPNLRLELNDLVEEDVNLALPGKFLCKEDCKGLCHICGKNLNNEQCSCKEPMDPRWAALAQLLDN